MKQASLRLLEGLSSLTPKERIPLEERTTEPGSSAWGHQGPRTTSSHLTPPGVPPGSRGRGSNSSHRAKPSQTSLRRTGWRKSLFANPETAPTAPRPSHRPASGLLSHPSLPLVPPWWSERPGAAGPGAVRGLWSRAWSCFSFLGSEWSPGTPETVPAPPAQGCSQEPLQHANCPLKNPNKR